jgi:hypothetical protein
MNTMKSARRCIFCGAGNLSKEHIWPQWMGEFLPSYPDNKRIEQLWTFTQKTFLVRAPDVQNRPGHTWNKTLRIVCRACNSGWMSKCEQMAKPVLLPLMTSQNYTLAPKQIDILSHWIALKVMIGEHSQPNDWVTPVEMRQRFKSALIMPEHFKIWIAKCGADGWECSYLRQAATISRSPAIRPERKNIHSVAFGVRDLFVLAMHTTEEGVLDKIGFSSEEAIVPLYPGYKEINWPPKYTLSSKQAAKVAKILDSVFASPDVIWRPLPDEIPSRSEG